MYDQVCIYIKGDIRTGASEGGREEEGDLPPVGHSPLGFFFALFISPLVKRSLSRP